MSHEGLLRAGHMSITGNFEQTGHERSFCATEEHKVFFAKSDELSQAYFESPYTSGFAKVTGYYITSNCEIWKGIKIIANFKLGIHLGAWAALAELADIFPDNLAEAGDLVATIGLFFGEKAVFVISSAIYLYIRAWYAVWEDRGSIEYTEDNKRCHASRASLLQEELARQIGAMVGGVMLAALLFELLDAKSGDIKTWVKGKLKDTTFINKINTEVPLNTPKTTN